MEVRVRSLRMDLDYKEKDLITKAAKKLAINYKAIKSYQIVKKAVDARRKKVYFNLTIDVELDKNIELSKEILAQAEITVIETKPEVPIIPGNIPLSKSPLIVGSGPAGLFCALHLARHGYKPVLIEKGMNIEERVKRVEKFWQDGVLDINNNTQFGEGGAGSFSDGKLTSRSGDARVANVLRTFVEFGAAEEITYLKKPHVGTDVIRQVVKRIRNEIIRLGGEVYFSCALTDINIEQGALKSIQINNDFELELPVMVLAVGHSAREVYRFLHAKGVNIIPKAFAVGVRVEHPQDIINHMQYAEFANHPALGSADYHFTYQDRSTGRSLYTFCMCPGGYVIAGSSGEGQVLTNGMSYNSRDSGVANSALVVTVSPEDWNFEALGGIKLQEDLEHKAFVMGGSNYAAPAQYMNDFMAGKASTAVKDSIATYRPGLYPANLWNLLPQEIAEVMFRGLKQWFKKAQDFNADEAIMTGVETRTSAPLRIVRNESHISQNVAGLYPCGEGAGYAGGIVSAAVDGLKIAESIIAIYALPDSKIDIQAEGIIKGSELIKD